MVELCLMASSTYPSGIFRQEQGLRRTNKEVRTLFSSAGTRQEVTRLGSLHLRPDHVEYPWQPSGQLLFSDNSIKLDSVIKKPVLIDMQGSQLITGARPDSGLFTFGIAEQRRRHAKIWQFFMSGSSEAEREELDFSLQSDFMGLQTLALMPPQPQISLYSDLSPYNVGPEDSQPSLIYPQSEFYPRKPFLDFIGNLDCSSRISMHPDGRILFTGTGSEMKDLLSLVAEFSLSKNSTDLRTRALLVPQITRPSKTETRSDTHEFVLRPKAVTATPLKSPRKTKQKQSSKRKTSKKAKKDLSGSNYSHAGECLLDLIFSKRRGKEAILSLKKSGRELPELLTQFSAGLAGTGLAVILFVVCRLTSGRVPFCNIKTLNTMFGFGLFWLSRGVYVLRNNISYFTERSIRSDLKDEMMMMKRVDKSLKEVFFRTATLLAVGLLRVA